MNRFCIFLCLIFNFIFSFHVSAANNVTLNFSGNIKASPCTVSSGNSMQIELNTIYVGTLKDIQTASEWKNFNISLINCSSNMTQVSLTFSGEPDSSDVNNLYKNLGTAKNLAIQLQGGLDNTPLGNQKKLNVALNNQKNIDIPLKVRAYTVTGNVTSGTILANITSTITYL
ncbi:type 1 fimbrial protein [Providencia rettgeri]